MPQADDDAPTSDTGPLPMFVSAKYPAAGSPPGRARIQACVTLPAGGVAEAAHLPALHAEGFDDGVSGDGLVEDVLDLG